MRIPKIAVVTCRSQRTLSISDNLLADTLRNYNYNIEIVIWDQRNIDWNNYQLILIRSVWDYIQKFNQFNRWLNHLRNIKANVWNPIEVIKWNANKTYLFDLEKNCIPIIPTVHITSHMKTDIENVITRNKWQRYVVKPIFGNGGDQIKIFNSEECKIFIENNIDSSDFLIQEYLEDISENGEISFIYFNKKFAHAIQKVPKSGDFRTNAAFGSKEMPYEPDVHDIEIADQVINSVQSDTLYARVDCINSRNKLFISELELIEPNLYLNFHPDSAKLFAAACATRI